MNRRTFFKRIAAAIAGGIAILILGKQKKPSPSMAKPVSSTKSKAIIDGKYCGRVHSWKISTGNPPKWKQSDATHVCTITGVSGDTTNPIDIEFFHIRSSHLKL